MRFAPVLVAMLAACFTMAAAPPPAKKPASSAHPPSGALKPASAKGDPYSVTVPVSASGPSASVAQNEAIVGGRAKAWAELSHRLAPQKEWSKLPALDSTGLERLIRGYTVGDERRSTTRYMARITYIFNPAAVRHLFRVSQIGYVDQGGTAILLVAMAPTYAAASPWAQALKQAKSPNAQFQLAVPIGDNVDQNALGPLRFATASWGELEPVASRVHANEAVLIQASNPNASHMEVHMRRIGPGRSFALPDLDVPVSPGMPPEKVYSIAAQQAEAAIEDAWKLRTSMDFSKKAKMVAEVKIISLDQWTDLLAKLGSVPAIMDVDLVAMNVGEARVNLTYSGTLEQLRDMAAQASLTFVNRDGLTWISRGKPETADAADGK